MEITNLQLRQPATVSVAYPSICGGFSWRNELSKDALAAVKIRVEKYGDNYEGV